MIYKALVGKKRMLVPLQKSGEVTEELKTAFFKEMLNLGFVITAPDFFSYFSIQELTVILEELRSLKGADKKWVPFYPDFPHYVRVTKEEILRFHQFLHYLTTYGAECLGIEVPTYFPRQGSKSQKVAESAELIPIALGTIEDVKELFYELVYTKVPLAKDDFDVIKELIKLFGWPVDGSKISFKEVLVFLYKEGVEVKKLTANDVLRLIVFLFTDSTVFNESKAFVNSFKVFFKPTRSQRLKIATLLSEVNELDLIESYKSKRRLWKVVFNKLHLGDYRSRFPTLVSLVTNLMSDGPKETFNSKVEKAIKEGNREVFSLLKMRPGNFVKRVLELSRKFDPNEVVDELATIQDKISIKLLISLLNGIRLRMKSLEYRIYFPVSFTGKYFIKEETQDDPTILYSLEQRIIEMLREKVSALEFDEFPKSEVKLPASLQGILVPLSVRNSSLGFEIEPGSYVTVKGIPRIGVWWQNLPRTRVDLDLSCMMFSSDWSECEHVSWINLVFELDGERVIYHSGDVTDAPKRRGGGAEFIDVLTTKGVPYRYCLLTVHWYNKWKEGSVECVLGVQDLEESFVVGAPQKAFNPSRLKYFTTIPLSGRSLLYGIYDIETKRFYFVNSQRLLGPSIAVSEHRLLAKFGNLVVHAMSSKFSVYELLTLYYSSITEAGTPLEVVKGVELSKLILNG